MPKTVLGWLLVLSSVSAIARTPARKTPVWVPPTPPPRGPQAEPGNLEASYNESKRPELVTGDVAILDLAGTAFPGAMITFNVHITRSLPLYVGGDFGFFITPSGPFGVVIPLLPSMRFEFETASKWRPLVGLALGPVISTGTGSTNVRYGMFLSPGLNVTVSNSAAVHFELRMGMIGSTFVHMPSAGITFAI